MATARARTSPIRDRMVRRFMRVPPKGHDTAGGARKHAGLVTNKGDAVGTNIDNCRRTWSRCTRSRADSDKRIVIEAMAAPSIHCGMTSQQRQNDRRQMVKLFGIKRQVSRHRTCRRMRRSIRPKQLLIDVTDWARQRNQASVLSATSFGRRRFGLNPTTIARSGASTSAPGRALLAFRSECARPRRSRRVRRSQAGIIVGRGPMDRQSFP